MKQSSKLLKIADLVSKTPQPLLRVNKDVIVEEPAIKKPVYLENGLEVTPLLSFKSKRDNTEIIYHWIIDDDCYVLLIPSQGNLYKHSPYIFPAALSVLIDFVLHVGFKGIL